MIAKLMHKRKAQKWKKLMNEIEEAKKDPEFMKDLKKFIKITTS